MPSKLILRDRILRIEEELFDARDSLLYYLETEEENALEDTRLSLERVLGKLAKFKSEFRLY